MARAARRPTQMRVQLINSKARLPQHATPDSAGLDLYLVEDAVLEPGEVSKLPTGITVSIPNRHVGLLRGRSSSALKRGILVVEGTIDVGYAGEVCILATALKYPVEVKAGERIAQLVVTPYASLECRAMDCPEMYRQPTERKGGFGSTGR